MLLNGGIESGVLALPYKYSLRFDRTVCMLDM